MIRKMSSKLKKSSSTEAAGAVTSDKSGNVLIRILAKPGAKANNVTSIDEESIGVQINAKPVEGEANAELISYFSQILALKKNQICLDKGSKSRHKTIVISCKECTADEIIEKLKQQLK